MEARVTLRPGSKGTKKLTEEYGDKLVCVRYRYDEVARKRYKTVEIIIDEVHWDTGRRQMKREPENRRPQNIVGLQVGFPEKAIRVAVKEAGGVWDSGMRLWLIAEGDARRLNLEARIVRVLPMPRSENGRKEV